jgi:hypothetical protein
MILALARPDPKKNITTLLKAFGECAPLRELANLVNPNTPPPLSIHPPVAVIRTEDGATSKPIFSSSKISSCNKLMMSLYVQEWISLVSKPLFILQQGGVL